MRRSTRVHEPTFSSALHAPAVNTLLEWKHHPQPAGLSLHAHPTSQLQFVVRVQLSCNFYEGHIEKEKLSGDTSPLRLSYSDTFPSETVPISTKSGSPSAIIPATTHSGKSEREI